MEGLDDRSGVWTTKQAAQSFQDRVVGFLSAEAFDALPARDARVCAEGCALMKHIYERRFADARLARDENDLPLALQRFLVGVFELREGAFASDEGAICGGRETSRSAGGFLANRGDKLIAAARERGDE